MTNRHSCTPTLLAIFLIAIFFNEHLHQRGVFAATLSPGTIVVGVSSDARSSPNFDTRLIAVDPNTAATSVVSANAAGTGPSLAFGPDGSYISYITQQNDGSLLVVDDSLVDSFGGPGADESRIYRVDPNTGNRSLILDVTGTTADKVINAARQVGNTIFATTNAGLETVDPSTSVVTPIATPGLATASPLYGLTNVGNQIYVAGRTDFYKVDATTGAATAFSGPAAGTGPTIGPIDLSIGPQGQLYADAINGTVGGVYSIDPVTGIPTAVSTTVSGGTPVGSGPQLIALTIGVAQSGTIYGIGIGGGLISIDPLTGNRTLVSQVESAPVTDVVCRGLVVLTNVPEPGGVILGTLGCLLAITYRYAGRKRMP
ncbi:MAG TPA: hypothetical protein VGN12_23195 [Pirellulales bacterium]|jgi:hypothetical protein